MSEIGDKFIFEITQTGLVSDNSNELKCGDFVTYISEKRIGTLIKYHAWTSINDGVPTEEGMYIVTFDDGFVTSTEWIDGDWELWADSGEVIAWMPIPPAYKKAE